MRIKKKLLHVLLSGALVLGSIGGDNWTIGSVAITDTAEAANGNGFEIEGTTLKKYTGSEATVQIPDGITTIGERAFQGCKTITGIVIPEGVKTIETYAFGSCSNLANVTLSKTVASIAGSAFSGSNNLMAFSVESDNGYFSSEDGILYTKDKTTLCSYPAGKTENSFQIPDGVTCIGAYAFSHAKLVTVEIPNSVKQLKDYAFEYCVNLGSIIGANGLQEIGIRAFNSCNGLTDFSLPENITTIGDDVFANCYNLVHITIPKNVKSFSGNPFVNCPKLTSIDVDEENSFFCSVDGVLYDSSMTRLIGYPAGKTTTSFQIPDSVVRIESDAFDWCKTIKEILIPDSVTTLVVERSLIVVV